MPRPSPSEHARALEAAVLLTVASVAIRLLPFRRLVRLMGRAGLAEPSVATDLRSVRVAIERATRRLPWRIVCFPQGLATHWMLRRRRVDSRLHYGIRPDGPRLSAHVWIEAQGEVVIGEEEQTAMHRQVAVFPNAASTRPGRR